MSTKFLKISAISASVAAAAITMSCCDRAPEQKPLDMSDERQKLSYAVGRAFASEIKDADSLNLDALVLGLRETLEDKPSQLPDSAILELNRKARNEIGEKRRQALRQLEEDNLAASRAFLEKNKTAEGIKVTESGLQYIMLTEGTGATPKASDEVKVHYHGTLTDGTVFDSSRDRGEPVSFKVTGVIRGWTEALQLMKVGSKIKIFIPPELAYGRRGQRGPIGPNMALIFEIELLEIAGVPNTAAAASTKK